MPHQPYSGCFSFRSFILFKLGINFGDVGFCGGGGKLENLEKTPWSKGRTINKLNLHLAPGWNGTWATQIETK